MRDDTGRVVKVMCPARYCLTWVELIDGRISAHPQVIPGVCPWIGTRVVDDSARIDPRHVVTIPETGVRR